MASLACLLPIVLIAFIGCSGQNYQPNFEITRPNRPPPLGRPYSTGLGSYIAKPAQEEIKQTKNVGRLATHRKTARYMGPPFPNLPYPLPPAPPLPYDPNGFPSVPYTFPLRPDPPLPPSPYSYFSHSAPGFEIPRNTYPSAYLGGFHPFYLGDLRTGHQGGQGGPDPTCLLCDPDQINCYQTNQGCPDPACLGDPTCQGCNPACLGDPTYQGTTDTDADLSNWLPPPESTPDQYGPTNF